jgi:flagellar motor switch protein FliG
MAEVDYSTLSKVQRLAMFLTVIGSDTASVILAAFDELEIEVISREMVALDLIAYETQQAVIEEFSPLLLSSVRSIKGGYQVALQTLEAARGPYAARNLVGKMAPSLDSKAIIDEISGMEAMQISNLLTAEQPQTIAFLLGAMDVNKAAETLDLLAHEVRSEVILRMGTLEPTSTEILNKVVKNLSKHLDSHGDKTMVHFGGASRVAALLNQMDKSVSKGLLAELEEANAVLGAKVRHKMFSFNDLVSLSVPDMQRVLREVDMPALVLAMKPAPAELKEKITNSLSTRAAEGLQDELDMLGAVRLKEVEAAQDAIIAIVRQLEEDDEITIGDDDDLV